MKTIYKFFLLVFLSFSFLTDAAAQLDRRLVAYYSFDSCGIANGPSINDDSGNGKNGVAQGNPGCGCGVSGQALQLDGIDDYVLLVGFQDFFRVTDLSISFYMKSTNSFGTQSILSKQENCDDINSFSIRYTPSSNFLTTQISEDASKKAVINEQLSFNDCWQHIVYVRSGGNTLLYVNGVLTGESATSSRVDISNSGTLSISQSPCLSTTDNAFAGLIDELRIYNRVLSRTEIEELYLGPDRIGNRDTLIFLGNSVPAFVGSTCADDFNWSPIATIDDPSSATPILTPTETTTYTLQASDAVCTATDTLRVTVVDPADLDCNQTYVPNAFTPNGDGRNEVYRISNPYAIDLISFEIYDRWGSRIFVTDSPFDGWDGAFKGQEMNPGVLLYRIRFRCDGQEEVSFGSFTLIR